ncbi:MAG TPA: hypothetical protein VFJ19_09650 [Nocardioidaceae bacterium]|nr:hypothetical protein [Nocardioidaceae bacterium]
MSTISEKCACGAEFNASSRYNSEVKHAASEWREEHKHAESVGICGNQPAWQGPKHIPIPYCVLKAGHEGAHGDGEGSHWWRTATDPTPDPTRAVCRDETTTTAEEATNG